MSGVWRTVYPGEIDEQQIVATLNRIADTSHRSR